MNSPKEIAQNYIAIGVAKTKLPAVKMLLLGVLAGMFIALAGVGSTIVSATIATPSLAKLLGAAVFPTGLAMVIIAGSELFTGNCLLIIPVLEKEAKLTGLLKNWIIVYIGNFIGSLLISVITVYGGTYALLADNAAAVTAISTAVKKVSLTFGDALLRGILCNFLVCIAVWIAFAAKDVVGKVAGLFLPIMMFVLSGYEHSIANMYYIPTGLLASKIEKFENIASGVANLDKLSWVSLFTKNLIPVTLGNIIGGVVLVGVFYWFIYLHTPKKKTVTAGVGKKKKKK